MASVTIASPCVNTSSINPRDDSFSSYLTLVRESFATELSPTGRTRSSFQINSNRRRSDDDEIDIFDAEKYFNGAMEYNTNILPEKELNLPYKKDKKASAKSRSRKTASTCSEASGNSRIGLLRQHSKAAKADGKKLLRVFLCTCSGKKATDTEVDVVSARESFGERNMMDEIRLASEMRMKRLELGFNEGLFDGPENLKGIEGKEVFGRELREGEKKVSLGTRESLNPSSEILATSLNNRCNGDNYDDDISSESSSDLFEINSTSINSQSFFEPYMADSAVYEPSEASIDWSVVTASAANFSVASRSDESRKQSTKGSRNRKGLLMGCVSHKAVNVTTDSHRYKLTKRDNKVETPDMPVQIGHEGFVAPAMRYQLEGLKKTESRSTPHQHAMPPTRPISRIQARQPIYIRS
ncbi:protein PHYTOCHROME KINASE SUBSTRATE 4 [Carex littledalei]|uniref:Protein PHYTOCHROME KINASE SUBSTRATE 4 n=1 Tax=Carex littledalei TaxID=544730 RepID=A0A833V686_9POAL|nr:protein PHYTOCHROME KINASE SUBSTRATE 4 [Carex littledalei]